MENNSQNKQRFFANYWGQNILLPDELLIDMPTTVENISSLGEDERLLLKSLSAISDEDAIEVAKLTYAMPHPNGTDFTVYLNQFGKKVVSWGDSFSQKYLAEIDTKTDIYNSLQADYLRSKGYLLPFMDLSTEQILEYKWAVIK